MVDVIAEFTLEPDVTYTADIKVETSTRDHDKLKNRDLPYQHPISAITGLETALDGKVDKTDKSSKVYGTDSDGNQTTYDVDSFGKVDDVKVGGVSVVTDKIAELGTMAGETASDYSTKAVADTLYAGIEYESTIDNHIADKNNPHEVTKAQVGLGNVDNTSDLNKPISTATQTVLDGKQAKITSTNKLLSDLVDDTNQNHLFVSSAEKSTWNGKQDALSTAQLNAVNSGITSLLVTQIGTNQTDIGTINGKIPSAASSSNQLADKSYVDTADTGLQEQIDAISASSDVTDIVGTHAELEAYDTSKLKDNDIIKVLQDETEGGATTYYRWIIVNQVGSFTLIGEEGPYYTKSQSDTLLAEKQNAIDSSHKLDSDLVDDTNQTNKFVTANEKSQITTNANNISSLQSGKADKATTLAGYGITDAYTKTTADSTFVPQTRTVNGKALSSNISLTYSDVGADASGSASTAETNAKNYADGLASNYATAAQGLKADSALQPNDNITQLTNNAGYITGITSSDVTTALGYTPYNSTNPNGYQANIIETVKVNGTALTPSNKAVDITVPTNTNQLTNGAGFIQYAMVITDYTA